MKSLEPATRYFESGLQFSAVTLSSKSAKVLTSSKGKNSFLNPGDRHIWTSLPTATAMREPSGLNWRAVTGLLKEMRWRMTWRRRLMNRQRRLLSTAMRKTPSGEAARREMSAEDWIGRVRVWDLMRSVTLTRLPTGEISRVLLLITTLPPLYGAPSRFWKR